MGLGMLGVLAWSASVLVSGILLVWLVLWLLLYVGPRLFAGAERRKGY